MAELKASLSRRNLLKTAAGTALSGAFGLSAAKPKQPDLDPR
jgi:hypothetical protein